ncbi:chlorite dismutase family protein [Acidianus manzaensis]|nr:chlorite dismutase family protein [Acidianus manzaensis]
MKNNPNSIYMLVFSLRFNRDWWRLQSLDRKDISSKMKEIEDKFSNQFISLKKYASLSKDSHLIYWISSDNTLKLIDFRFSIISNLRGYAEENDIFLSVFRPSPYMKKNSNIDYKSILNLPPLKYFVAYPMKKDPEWYLLPFEDRENIMKEHISMAINNPDNNGIRSYTTYSFGIGDYEFVVIYEIPDLRNWVNVVEKLREAKARKWITKEEPLLVGEVRDFDFLI